MNLAEIIPNDIVDSDNGICVSVWVSGCDIRCKGCHNEQLWTPKDTADIGDVIEDIIRLLQDNGIQRSLSILGGEPLALYNRQDIADICQYIKEALPETFIRIWTGRTWKQIQEQKDQDIIRILKYSNQLIVGPYIQELRDTRLELRGSSNQEIINL